MAKGKFMIGAVVGAIAGIVAGVLTAPKSGKETRADLKQKAVDLKQNVSSKTEDIMEKSDDFATDMKERADRGIESAKGFTNKE
ncbi:MAG TPA: YtxH domain-containing protein [Candidatus Saccharimonadales bacterium]|nr:YtxH domain-containing protein [Candidatus Saccharimonadales bacterium]